MTRAPRSPAPPSPSVSPGLALRVGVIEQGRLLEERLVTEPGDVTFGSDAGCTFVLTGEGVPRRVRLFSKRGGEWSLHAAPDVDGSVSRGPEERAPLAALVETAGGRVALTAKARGRLELGEGTVLLFHFVAPPPPRPKPKLPSSVRRGWLKQVEPVFTTVLSLSFLVHAVTTVVVFQVDAPPPVSRQEVLEWMGRALPEAVKVREPAPPPATAAADVAPPPAVEPRPAPRPVAGPTAGGRPGGPPKTSQDVADEVRGAAQGILAIIGQAGTGAGAGVSDTIAALEDGGLSTLAPPGGVTTSGNITRRSTGGSGGKERPLDVTDLAPPRPAGPTAVVTGTKKGADLTSQIEEEKIEVEDGKLDARALRKVLQRNAGRFKQCYESSLKSNSKLSGKIALELVVGERGRLVDVEVVTDSLGAPDVTRCVVSNLRTLRFPAPEGGEVVVSYSFVFTRS